MSSDRKGLGILWGNGLVPYKFDKEIEPISEIVIDAMWEIYLTGFIKFVPRTCENDYLLITKGEWCETVVGRRGGIQKLYINLEKLTRTVIMHEFCHAIGLYHEHQRSIRDDYINVHYDNIAEEHRVNFIKMIPEDDLEGLPFDYLSVMLYGKYTFSKNRKHTLTARDDETRYLPSTDRKTGLSEGDIIKLQHMYGIEQDRSIAFEVPLIHYRQQFTNEGRQNSRCNYSRGTRSRGRGYSNPPPTIFLPYKPRPRAPNFINSLNEYRFPQKQRESVPHSQRSKSQDDVNRRRFDLHPFDKQSNIGYETQWRNIQFSKNKANSNQDTVKSYDCNSRQVSGNWRNDANSSFNKRPGENAQSDEENESSHIKSKEDKNKNTSKSNRSPIQMLKNREDNLSNSTNVDVKNKIMPIKNKSKSNIPASKTLEESDGGFVVSSEILLEPKKLKQIKNKCRKHLKKLEVVEQNQDTLEEQRQSPEEVNIAKEDAGVLHLDSEKLEKLEQNTVELDEDAKKLDGLGQNQNKQDSEQINELEQDEEKLKEAEQKLEEIENFGQNLEETEQDSKKLADLEPKSKEMGKIKKN